MKKIITAALVILVGFLIFALFRTPDQSGELGNMVGAIFLFVLYFVPSLIAGQRKHPQRNSISAINIFLGWTLIGWVVALAMSLSHIKEK